MSKQKWGLWFVLWLATVSSMGLFINVCVYHPQTAIGLCVGVLIVLMVIIIGALTHAFVKEVL